MKLFHLLGERTVFEFRYSITLPSLGLAEPPSLTGVGVSICCVLVGSKTLSINCYWPAIRQGETGPLEARASVASDTVGSGPVWDLHFRLPVLDLGLDLGLGLGRIPVHERWLSLRWPVLPCFGPARRRAKKERSTPLFLSELKMLDSVQREPGCATRRSRAGLSSL